MWENNITASRRETELDLFYIYIIDVTYIIIISWRYFIGKSGPNCCKIVIKSIRKLTRTITILSPLYCWWDGKQAR